jgi:hypothetical protein
MEEVRIIHKRTSKVLILGFQILIPHFDWFKPVTLEP